MTKPRTMPFLINPPRGSTVKTKTRSTGRKRRNPPKGFRTWKAYMASIRPGAKKRVRSNPSGGSSVKRKRKRRKATGRAVVRRNPSRALVNAPRRRGRRFRRNPPSMLKALPSFAGSAMLGAVAATLGKAGARKGRALARQEPGTVFGMAAEALIALGVGIGVAQVSPQFGRDMALGGLQSVLEGGIHRLKVPVLSDALGADDYYLGFSDGVDALQGGGLAGYVAGPGSQFGEELGAPDSGARFMLA